MLSSRQQSFVSLIQEGHHDALWIGHAARFHDHVVDRVRTRSRSCSSEITRSSRISQQMQPFVRLIVFSSTPSTSSASMLMAPKSLTSTPTRRPCCPLRMRFSNVVLPEPRKAGQERDGDGIAARNADGLGSRSRSEYRVRVFVHSFL